MANYTVKNLKQVDNAAEQFGMDDNLEARFARKPLELENFGVSYQRLEPNFRIPFGHKHGTRKSSISCTARPHQARRRDRGARAMGCDPRSRRGDAQHRAGPNGSSTWRSALRTEDAEMVQEWWTD